MKYDFDKIGKEHMLDELKRSIFGQANYLQESNISASQTMDTLNKINVLSRDAKNILVSLTKK